MKKVWRFLSSMRLAMVLLVLLAVVCAGGSFLTQGQTLDWYAARYGERAAGLIVGLGLDDVFHCWWFLVLAGFLCASLILCNVSRVAGLIRRTRAAASPEPAQGAALKAEAVADPAPVFAALGLTPKQGAAADGREVRFACRHRAGLWGAWICHVGILLLLVGYGLGQLTQFSAAVYGVAGRTLAVPDTDLTLTIEDFHVDLRPDDTVAQYTAEIRVSDGTRTQTGTASVNHPAQLFGYKFYQNSTGWAVTVRVYKAGQLLQEQVLCGGEALAVEDKPELVLLFNAFYPDCVMTASGPSTASGSLNNPASLYTLYYRAPGASGPEVLGMNVLRTDEKITVSDYEITMTDPQNYTLLQIRQDRFTWLALLGGLITLLGLVLALWLKPAAVRAVREADGTWTLTADCRKGGAPFRERFFRAAGKEEPDAAS